MDIRDYRTNKGNCTITISGKEGDYQYFVEGNIEMFCELECDMCKRYVLDARYVYIIEKLRKAGLISKEYPFLCCQCKTVFDGLAKRDFKTFSDFIFVKYMSIGKNGFKEWFSILNATVNLDLIKILKQTLSDERWKKISKIL